MRYLGKIAMVCLFVCLNMSVSAQTSSFRYGFKAGLNLSTALVEEARSCKLKPGFHVGPTVEYSLSQRFYIQSGLLLSMKGSKIEALNSGNYIGGEPNFTHTFNQFYLELPLYGTYKASISRNIDIALGVGPYFGYGMGGKIKRIWADEETETKWDTFKDGVFDESRDWLRGESLKKMDFGVGIKVDLEYDKYVFGIGFGSSIIDIAEKHGYQGFQYRNFNINVSMGYKF